MQIQRYNKKCESEQGYIVGDLGLDVTHQRLDSVIHDYFGSKKIDIDVIIATPPCQGMSVANHKKKNELRRNSLVVESIIVTRKYLPKFFVFENVRGFSKAICTDVDEVDKPIGEAIVNNLAKHYHIESQVLNLKNYGANSSRTRTLVIGVRRDQVNTCPLLFFPDYTEEKSLKQVIGHLPSLSKMGEFSDDDFFHSFRPYQKRMLPWIEATPYGASAFDNKEDHLKPHQVKNDKLILNQRKNGGKYERQEWDKVAPCVHTRSDCLASQNTVHPVDNRVFSIREIMLMMSVPNSFQWLEPEVKLEELSSYSEKNTLRAKTEKLIRESLGEAVPTRVMTNIARKIKEYLTHPPLTKKEINSLIDDLNLKRGENLQLFIKEAETVSIPDLFKICDLANGDRDDNAAFHTSVDIAYSSIEYLPSEDQFKSKITALEPSVGAGVFVFLLAKKYPNLALEFDCVDIDENALKVLKALADRFNLHNLEINYIHDDFITTRKLKKRYDLVVGNPPFMKVKNAQLLKSYQGEVLYTKSNNIFTYFIEKCLLLAKDLVLITPKALLGAPDYSISRHLLESRAIRHINDFNEKAFDVRIETISFYVSDKADPPKHKQGGEEPPVLIYSYLNKTLEYKPQSYITDNLFDTWLLYRDDVFDKTCETLNFGVFKVFRDRQLTARNTKESGKYRVIKARNIGNNQIINNPEVNRYVDSLTHLAVSQYINSDSILIPNLTYNPRAARLPKGCIADGSAAILYSESGYKPTDCDIEYFGSKEFNHFYRIARNYGTRSLNIDSNSVNYFGIKKH